MVTDRLEHADLYRGLSARIARAFEYVERTNFADVEDGRYPIEDGLVALVQRYRTKPLEDSRWEAHRKHIDLQLVVSGAERIGYASLNSLHAEPYDEAKDLLWLSGSAGQWIDMPAGHFMLLWPGDAHMPGVHATDGEDVLKVVVKIAVAKEEN